MRSSTASLTKCAGIVSGPATMPSTSGTMLASRVAIASAKYLRGADRLSLVSIDAAGSSERRLVSYSVGEEAFGTTGGIAANELSCQPRPVGSNFWKIADGIDFAALSEASLTAFVRGLRGGE